MLIQQAVRFLVAILIAAGVVQSREATYGDEFRLREFLFTNHSTSIRPVLHQSEQLVVNFTFFLQSILELNERKQTLRTSGFFSIQWADETLTWDPDKFGGVQEILVQSSEIWLPDIIVVNGVEGYTTDMMTPAPLVLLHFTGKTDWTPGGVLETHCPIDISLYPFDTQVCDMVIGTWMHSLQKIVFLSNMDSMDLFQSWKSGEWAYANSSAIATSTSYGGANYSNVILSVSLRRLRLFYIINVITPTICLSLLNIIVCCVPTESGERTPIAVTSLLAYALFQSSFSGSMPETSNNVCLLAVYLTMILVMAMICALVSGLEMQLYYKKGKPKRNVSRTGSLRVVSHTQGEKDTEMIPVNTMEGPDTMTPRQDKTVDCNGRYNDLNTFDECDPTTSVQNGALKYSTNLVAQIDKYSLYISVMVTVAGIAMLVISLFI